MDETERAVDAYANWQAIRHAEPTASAIGPREVYLHLFEGGTLEPAQWRYLTEHPGLVDLVKQLSGARAVHAMPQLAAASTGAEPKRRHGPVMIEVTEDPELPHLKRISLAFDEEWAGPWPKMYVLWVPGRLAFLDLRTPAEGSRYVEWDVDTLLHYGIGEAIDLIQDPASKGFLLD